MPLVYDSHYRLGTRTFLYTYAQYGWSITLLGGGLLYLAYAIYFGSLRVGTDAFLATHHSWYIDSGMLSEWLFLTAISCFIVGLMRGLVMYRHKTFMVDRRALHLRRGLFRTRETRIPYQQISNIEMERPYHFRILGLAQLDVTISSGDRDTGRTSDTREFLIPIIDAHLAHALAHHIIIHTDQHATFDEDEYEDDDEFEDEEDAEEYEENDNDEDFTDTEKQESARYVVYR